MYCENKITVREVWIYSFVIVCGEVFYLKQWSTVTWPVEDVNTRKTVARVVALMV